MTSSTVLGDPRIDFVRSPRDGPIAKLHAAGESLLCFEHASLRIAQSCDSEHFVAAEQTGLGG
jgi:hypothetical protein